MAWLSLGLILLVLPTFGLGLATFGWSKVITPTPIAGLSLAESQLIGFILLLIGLGLLYADVEIFRRLFGFAKEWSTLS